MTNITEWHREFFNGLKDWDNLALFSCFVNGEPTAAIVAVERRNGMVDIGPVAVFVTPGMVITDHDGNEPGEFDDKVGRTREPGD